MLGACTVQRGFSVLELMVTVAILAVLAILAGPSFQPLIERWRVRSAAEDLASTLYFVRSEGIKRGGGVILKASDGADWSQGLIVFQDVNGNGTQDTCNTTITPNECDLRVAAAFAQVTITSNPADTTTLAADRWGAFGADVTWVFTPKGGDASSASARKLCLAASGRVKQIQGSASCD